MKFSNMVIYGYTANPCEDILCSFSFSFDKYIIFDNNIGFTSFSKIFFFNRIENGLKLGLVFNRFKIRMGGSFITYNSPRVLILKRRGHLLHTGGTLFVTSIIVIFLIFGHHCFIIELLSILFFRRKCIFFLLS